MYHFINLMGGKPLMEKYLKDTISKMSQDHKLE